MTNEKKINEIAGLLSINAGEYTIVRAAALKMAEWKDQQFKEFLEKKIKECDDIAIRRANFGDDWKKYDCFISVYKQIINELFKEE